LKGKSTFYKLHQIIELSTGLSTIYKVLALNENDKVLSQKDRRIDFGGVEKILK
jgi:hypothetical protein